MYDTTVEEWVSKEHWDREGLLGQLGWGVTEYIWRPQMERLSDSTTCGDAVDNQFTLLQLV